MNEAGQVRYTDGEYVLTVVPGRDKVDGNPDPATYQKDKEPELAPYRSSTWASGGDVKTTKVGSQLRVTGRYIGSTATAAASLPGISSWRSAAATTSSW